MKNKKKMWGGSRGSGNPNKTEDGSDSFEYIDELLENLQKPVEPEYQYQRVNPDLREYRDNGEEMY